MADSSPRVLVVDDEPELRALVQRYLSENGFTVRVAGDSKAMDQMLAREPVDAIILDLVLPGEDGLAICRRLRASGEDVPIIMLTARGDPIDRILGIEMGADDYLPKPFTPRELLARLTAILRRAQGLSGARVRSKSMAFGPFVLDTTAMRLTREGEPVELSAREYALLTALAHHCGRPLSRARIIDLAFGRDADVTDRAVDVQITRLRKALGEDPSDPNWIKTVWGVGYVLAAGDAA
jgi:two-component system, OmpR family, phosphate regulon response regulator OmpR